MGASLSSFLVRMVYCISRRSTGSAEKIEDTDLQEGQQVEVKLIDIDPKTGKFKLSRRALLPKPEGYKEPERRPRPERGERRH